MTATQELVARNEVYRALCDTGWRPSYLRGKVWVLACTKAALVGPSVSRRGMGSRFSDAGGPQGSPSPSLGWSTRGEG